MTQADLPRQTPDSPSPPTTGGGGDPRVAADQCDALATVLVDRLAQAEQLQAKIASLQADIGRLQATRSFRIAQAIAAAKGDWSAALRLPATLFDLAFNRPAEVAAQPALTPLASSAAAASFAPCSPRDGRLRIAAIVDALSEVALAPECHFLQLDPEHAVRQLDEFQPDVLFVESAWSGTGGRWADKLVPASDALLRVLLHCRRIHVPTVFWNKEDPVHHSHFLGLARHFDFIFTTDSDCVEAYRLATGRRDVGVLPFACQPRLHHPVVPGEREDAFVFAGSYYRQHAARSRDFERLAEAVAALRPLHIYDRNDGRQHPDFSYPERWHGHIRGCVGPGEVPALYRAHRYALNVNTIRNSPTMFARRVFELLACGTCVVSNGSLAESTLFPGLTLSAAQPQELEAALHRLVSDEPYQRRLRTLGVRHVMSAHTWKHRLDAVSRLVGLTRRPEAEPTVLVVSRTHSPQDTERVLEMFRSQTHGALECQIVADHPAGDLRPGERVVPPEEAERLVLDGQLVAGWFHRDSYGPDYVTDLALARAYSDAAAIGKAAHFAVDGGRVERRGDGLQYRTVDSLACRRALVAVPAGAGITARRFTDRLESGRVARGGALADAVVGIDAASYLLAVDEFNYCEEGNGLLPEEADDALR